MNRTNKGSLSAMVVCLVMATMSLAGLAYDGGRVVSVYMEVSDTAQNAARLGGQQLVDIRSGHPHIDENSATSAMRAYLMARGLTGKFYVRGTESTVKISKKVPMRILGIIGIGERTIRVIRSVDVVDG